jgi:hypothetical protein
MMEVLTLAIWKTSTTTHGRSHPGQHTLDCEEPHMPPALRSADTAVGSLLSTCRVEHTANRPTGQLDHRHSPWWIINPPLRGPPTLEPLDGGEQTRNADRVRLGIESTDTATSQRRPALARLYR